MDSLRSLLDAASSRIENLTGLKVLYDPQPVRMGGPHLRLTYMGSEECGHGAMRLKWQVSLIGAGDGPDVYLPAVIRASIAVEELYDRCRRPGFEDLVVDGVTVRMCFDAALTASGGFSQNEQKVVETGQWSYLWTEPRYVSMTVPDTFWKTGDRT